MKTKEWAVQKSRGLFGLHQTWRFVSGGEVSSLLRPLISSAPPEEDITSVNHHAARRKATSATSDSYYDSYSGTSYSRSYSSTPYYYSTSYSSYGSRSGSVVWSASFDVVAEDDDVNTLATSTSALLSDASFQTAVTNDLGSSVDVDTGTIDIITTTRPPTALPTISATRAL